VLINIFTHSTSTITVRYNMFYMSAREWSPRFDESFFTCYIISRATLHSTPDATYKNIQSHTHPALYFNIKVKRGRKEEIVARRYSHFRSLYDDVRRNPPDYDDVRTSNQVHFPPKTCFFSKIDDDFLDNREEELGIFLEHLLKQPNYSKHPAVREFLGLDGINSDS